MSEVAMNETSFSADTESDGELTENKKKRRKEFFHINTHPATVPDLAANNKRDKRLKHIVMRVVAFCKKEHEEGLQIPFRFFKKRASVMTGVSLSTIHRIETIDMKLNSSDSEEEETDGEKKKKKKAEKLKKKKKEIRVRQKGEANKNNTTSNSSAIVTRQTASSGAASAAPIHKYLSLGGNTTLTSIQANDSNNRGTAMIHYGNLTGLTTRGMVLPVHQLPNDSMTGMSSSVPTGGVAGMSSSSDTARQKEKKKKKAKRSDCHQTAADCGDSATEPTPSLSLLLPANLEGMTVVSSAPNPGFQSVGLSSIVCNNNSSSSSGESGSRGGDSQMAGDNSTTVRGSGENGVGGDSATCGGSSGGGWLTESSCGEVTVPPGSALHTLANLTTLGLTNHHQFNNSHIINHNSSSNHHLLNGSSSAVLVNPANAAASGHLGQFGAGVSQLGQVGGQFHLSPGQQGVGQLQLASGMGHVGVGTGGAGQLGASGTGQFGAALGQSGTGIRQLCLGTAGQALAGGQITVNTVQDQQHRFLQYSPWVGTSSHLGSFTINGQTVFQQHQQPTQQTQQQQQQQQQQGQDFPQHITVTLNPVVQPPQQPQQYQQLVCSSSPATTSASTVTLQLPSNLQLSTSQPLQLQFSGAQHLAATHTSSLPFSAALPFSHLQPLLTGSGSAGSVYAQQAPGGQMDGWSQMMTGSLSALQSVLGGQQPIVHAAYSQSGGLAIGGFNVANVNFPGNGSNLVAGGSSDGGSNSTDSYSTVRFTSNGEVNTDGALPPGTEGVITDEVAHTGSVGVNPTSASTSNSATTSTPTIASHSIQQNLQQQQHQHPQQHQQQFSFYSG